MKDGVLNGEGSEMIKQEQELPRIDKLAYEFFIHNCQEGKNVLVWLIWLTTSRCQQPPLLSSMSEKKSRLGHQLFFPFKHI